MESGFYVDKARGKTSVIFAVFPKCKNVKLREDLILNKYMFWGLLNSRKCIKATSDVEEYRFDYIIKPLENRRFESVKFVRYSKVFTIGK